MRVLDLFCGAVVLLYECANQLSELWKTRRDTATNTKVLLVVMRQSECLGYHQDEDLSSLWVRVSGKWTRRCKPVDRSHRGNINNSVGVQ